MRSTTVRSALAVLAATTVTAGLAACGGGGGSGGSGGGGTNGAGKTLDVYIGANTQFPKEFAAWQQDIANQFKTQTGATVKWETFASANDEVTKIETSAVSGNGPDIYGVGTTMTPTAYATGAFTKLDDAAWQKVGGKDKFLPATLGISGPDAEQPDRHPVGHAARSSWPTTRTCSRPPGSRSRRPRGTSSPSRPRR